MDDKIKKGLIGGAVVVAIGTGEEVIRRALRKKGQLKLQKKVDSTMPKCTNKDLAVAENHVQLTVCKETDTDLTQFQKVPMSKEEADQWKSLISTIGSETLKAGISMSAFDGLLKCDVPLKDLCRVKGDSSALRGWVVNDGKISKQATFSKAEVKQAAPILIYQCMAAVTSQYYQQIITERLDLINSKLDNILKILLADDRAKIKVSYRRLLELSKKSTYDIADKQIASEFLGYVEIVREKYKDLLSGIKNLNVDYQRSDKKEAEAKVQKLRDSHYFETLEMAIQSEVLYYIGNVVSLHIAQSLGNTEDMKIYADRLSLDFWNEYVDQFNHLKHDVTKYLELEADSSLFQSKSIREMRKQCLKQFNVREAAMKQLQDQFDKKAIQYIRLDKEGIPTKYISMSEN